MALITLWIMKGYHNILYRRLKKEIEKVGGKVQEARLEEVIRNFESLYEELIKNQRLPPQGEIPKEQYNAFVKYMEKRGVLTADGELNVEGLRRRLQRLERLEKGFQRLEKFLENYLKNFGRHEYELNLMLKRERERRKEKEKEEKRKERERLERMIKKRRKREREKNGKKNEWWERWREGRKKRYSRHP